MNNEFHQIKENMTRGELNRLRESYVIHSDPYTFGLLLFISITLTSWLIAFLVYSYLTEPELFDFF